MARADEPSAGKVDATEAVTLYCGVGVVDEG
jgi:hypothetical protein